MQANGVRSRGGIAHEIEFPEFRARAPWWTGDLQTTRNLLVRAGALPAEAPLRIWIDLGDGDRLAATLERPDGPSRCAVVLVHGLGGCEDSSYLQLAAADWLAAGFSVIRLNLRGAGASRAVCRGRYDAGRTGDLRIALRALPAHLPSGTRLLLVGFSLGGNLALKLAGEPDPGEQLAGVVSVSAPIDLAEASRRIHARRNAFYHRYLLGNLKRQLLEPGPPVAPTERRALESVRSLWEFDDRIVAPRGGYADASDYYDRASARRVLAAIRIPALLIHAADDPWIPVGAYRAAEAELPPSARVLLAPGGGHVGFHGRGSARPWHQLCAERFAAAVLGAADAAEPAADARAAGAMS
jgi:predicted alpha/beta-fold hydrolase